MTAGHELPLLPFAVLSGRAGSFFLRPAVAAAGVPWLAGRWRLPSLWAFRRVPVRPEGLELVRVEGSELRLIFNELMASEHPRSARLHVGRQLRYLIGSSHGWLGGFLFAPATRVLAARDAWLGWDDASRERHLDEVIGLARFLIRP